MATKNPRLAESWSYVLLRDLALPIEQQSVFRLLPLTQAERLAAFDDSSRTVIDRDGSQVIQGRSRQVALSLCLSHIGDVQNFPAGAPESWPADREARARYLEGLDDGAVNELGEEIYTRSSIGVLEKNFSPPERTSSSGESSGATTSTTVTPAPDSPP